MNTKNLIKKIFVRLLNIKDERVWIYQINRTYKQLGVKGSKVNKEIVLRHIKYWQQLKKKINTKWFEVYSFITGNDDIHFVPENIYFNIIEPKLNNRKLALAYADKNFYEIFYGNSEVFPETIVRNIDGLFYDKQYKLLEINDELLWDIWGKYEKILVKPSVDSGGGKKIQLFFRKDGNFVNGESQKLTLSYLIDKFSDNFIIQNYITQSNYLAQFNPTSVNTIRVFTYRSVKTDEVIPLHAVLRIGKKGNYVDDQNVGGVACYINENAILSKYATNIYGEKFFEYNGIVFAEIEAVPKIKEIKDCASKLARKNIHSRVIGFDFTLDSQNNIKLIEINHLWTGINFFQMNGYPVLGNYTDEVVEFCKASS